MEVFTDFVAEVEPRLHAALIPSLGLEYAGEATAEALAWAWEHWDRIEPMDNAAGYLYRVELIEVEGTFDAVLEPGDVVVLAGDITVTERIRPDVVVTAVPINEGGDPVPDRTVRNGSRVAIDVFTPEVEEPDELPGFGDAWNRGVSVLLTIVSIVLIVVGAILPWLWLPALIALIISWRRRR